MSVRVASLKAITAFLCSIEEESIVLKYQDMMGSLLDMVVEVLRNDEDKGRSAIDSMIELSQYHGEIWSLVIDKLIFVVSEIIKNESFENSTRQ